MNLEEHVITLQKNFLFERFLKSVTQNSSLIKAMHSFTEENQNQNLNLFDNKALDDDNFENLKKLLMDKENIKKINEMLVRLYRYYGVDQNIAPKINSKKFMSAWMLVSFPEIVIGKTKLHINNENNYPDDIYFISKKMINLFTELTICDINNSSELRRKFFKSFNQFSNAINYFLNRDKVEKIFSLTREYFDMCKTLNLITESKKYSDHAKKECEKVINESKNKIILFMQSLDDSIKRDELELYANLENIKNKKIEETQFKILIDDIKSKKFIFLGKVINEIKQNITKLCGSSKICHDIEDILDSDFLIRSMTYFPFEKNDIEKYGNYLINIINELQAPIKVKDTKEKWENLKNEVNDMDEYLARMLFLVFEEIRDIKETIMNLSAMSSVGINFF